jgi:hypothetical protein
MTADGKILVHDRILDEVKKQGIGQAWQTAAPLPTMVWSLAETDRGECNTSVKSRQSDFGLFPHHGNGKQGP